MRVSASDTLPHLPKLVGWDIQQTADSQRVVPTDPQLTLVDAIDRAKRAGLCVDEEGYILKPEVDSVFG